MEQWTGLLVLHGTGDLMPVLLSAFHSSGHVVYGNVNPVLASVPVPNRKMFDTLNVDEDIIPALEHVNANWSAKPHAFVIGSNSVPSSVTIPNRSADIFSWVQGIVNHLQGEMAPIKHLLYINHDSTNESSEKKNYTALLADKVCSNIPGKWDLCMSYIGTRSVFVLASRNVSLNLWLVFFDGVFFLLWSTNASAIDQIEYDIGKYAASNKERFFQKSISIPVNNVLSLHPLYLVSKFARKMSSYPSKARGNLLICNFVTGYLQRQCRPIHSD